MKLGDRVIIINGPWDGNLGIIEKITKSIIKVRISTSGKLALVNPQHVQVKNFPTQRAASDFDGGFGIGGLSRYQPTAAEEMARIEAEDRHAQREANRVRKGPLPHGQLWEPCPICRREPVCVDCGVCEKHCDC